MRRSRAAICQKLSDFLGAIYQEGSPRSAAGMMGLRIALAEEDARSGATGRLDFGGMKGGTTGKTIAGAKEETGAAGLVKLGVADVATCVARGGTGGAIEGAAGRVILDLDGEAETGWESELGTDGTDLRGVGEM